MASKGNLVVSPQRTLPSGDALLYRYVTIDKLIDFLLNGRITFTRLSLFEDRLEGVTPQHLLLNLASNRIAEEMKAPWLGELAQLVTLNINPTRRNSLRLQREQFQQNNYANCWYIDKHESVAMWQLYSRRDSVAIRIPFKEMSSRLDMGNFSLTGYRHEKLRYGNLSYIRYNDIDQLQEYVLDQTLQGFIKDQSYSHEQEFRVMLTTTPSETEKAEMKPFLLAEQVDEVNERLNIKTIYMVFPDFGSMPFELVFHPQCPDWHRANVLTLMKRLDLPFTARESVLKDIFKG